MDRKVYIDINCDVGEGVDNEQHLLPIISSCNVACGAHAGNNEIIREVVKLAKKHQVKVGAHPSYPDRENFGRISLDIPHKDLMNSVLQQLHNFNSIVKEEEIALHHIKPHGALYNDLAKNTNLALQFLKTIVSYKNTVFLYVPYGSIIAKLALEQGYKIKQEVFGDRNYNEDVSLVSRKEPNAVIEDPKIVLDHITRMVKHKQLKTIKGKLITIHADTFCIHGDTPTAIQIIQYLSKSLQNENIYIRK